MTGDSRLSRLNPVYLAVRNGGAFFLCLALGLAGGLLYQIVATPRHFVAKGSRALLVAPPEAAPEHDWESAAARFSAFLRNPDRHGLLTANLRFALKHSLAVAFDNTEDRSAALRERLLEHARPTILDTSPWDRRVPPYFGPDLNLSLSDFPANLDYQSLASILADVDPPAGKTGWDLSFFEPGDGEAGLTAADMVTRPGPEDRFFAVFYRIHELRGRPAAFSPETAWRSAVAELGERLLRESEFRGGGGFGNRATLELLREFEVIPTLAANGLYAPAGRFYGAHDPAPWERDLWRRRWSAAEVTLERSEPDRALLTLVLPNTLFPMNFPADSPMTRIDGLAVEVALLYMGVVLERDAKRLAELHAAIAPAEGEVPAAESPGPSPEPEAGMPHMPDPAPPPAPEPPSGAADAEYRIRIASLERAAVEAKKARDGCALAYGAARDEADLAAREALAARERADRVKERLDGMEMRETEIRGERLESPEILELRKLRENILRRLAELRLASTEEHPFVRAAVRELAAVEQRLLEVDDGAAAAALEERRIRIKNLGLEHAIAEDAAESLADRRNSVAEAADCLLAELANAEACLLEAEHALAAQLEPRALKVESMDLVAGNIGRLADGVARLSEVRDAPPPPEPAPEPAQPEPAAQPAPAPSMRLVFSPGPSEVDVAGVPLSPRPLEIGTGLGLCLGLLWMLLHETFGSRLTNAFEARRWIKVPVLASIPRYDPRSLAAGAKSLDGKLEPYGRRRTLIPPSIDMTEPAPIGKRRMLVFRRAFRRWRAFALGVIILLVAAGLRQVAVGDAWRVPPGARPPMFREGGR